MGCTTFRRAWSSATKQRWVVSGFLWPAMACASRTLPPTLTTALAVLVMKVRRAL